MRPNMSLLCFIIKMLTLDTVVNKWLDVPVNRVILEHARAI